MRTANTAVQAMFLFQGFIGQKEDLEDTGMGQIEVAQYLAPWAARIDEYLEKLVDENWSFPGVFEYEVTEEFGAWLRTNDVNNDAYIWTKLVNLTSSFLLRGTCKS